MTCNFSVVHIRPESDFFPPIILHLQDEHDIEGSITRWGVEENSWLYIDDNGTPPTENTLKEKINWLINNEWDWISFSLKLVELSQASSVADTLSLARLFSNV